MGDAAELRKCPIRDAAVRRERLFLLRGQWGVGDASLQWAERDACHLLDKLPNRWSGQPAAVPARRLLRSDVSVGAR